MARSTTKPKRPNREKTVPLNRLQRFALFFFDHARLTLLLWATALMIGALSYTVLMRREGFPSVSIPVSIANGTYFVNDAAKVDREIVRPLSELIKRDERVVSVAGSSAKNFYNLQIEYDEGVDPQTASADLEKQAAEQRLLPGGATATFQPISFSVDPEGQGDDILVAFYADEPTDLAKLEAKAAEAREYLAGSNGIKGAERVRLVELYRTGTDPRTGREVREQKSFDRITVREDDLKLHPSAVIAVKGVSATDELELFDQTELALERLRGEEQFAGYDAAISADLAEGVRAQIASLQENLLGGLLAVLVVSFLLISLRASIVTAISMITVLTMTVAILYAAGLTINTITLFALILCLGLIVDDTTIMVEAIDAGRGQKKKRREIAAAAVKRVARASAAGTFTTMLGFAPLLFIGGILGDFVFAIPVTIIISLALSLLISLTLVPFLSRLIVPEGDGGHSISPLKGAEAFISNRLASLLRVGLRSRRKLAAIGTAMIILSLVLTAAGGALFSKVRFNIFPSAKDADAVLVSVRFEPGTDIKTAEEITDIVADRTITSIGQHVRRATLAGTGSSDSALLTVELTSYKEREPTSRQLIEQLDRTLADIEIADIEVSQIDVGPPAGAFGVQIYGDDRQKTLKLAGDITSFLETLEVTRADGSKAAISKVQPVNPTTISRSDGQKLVSVQAEFEAEDTTALVTLAQDEVEKAFPPDRVKSYGLAEDALRFDFGEESDNQESFKAMLIAFPILLVAMYVLLAVQFRSFSQPVIIFLAIPFSIFGVMGGLYLTDNPFSFFTMIGVFALLGISVNNTILLTDFANQARSTGARRIEAMAAALQARFRPLITTSLTSIVALLPLALSDPFWESLAVTLIVGLLSSTVLVVLAFPYYYLGLEYLRVRIPAFKFILWLLGLVAAGWLAGALKAPLLVFLALYAVSTLVLRNHWKRF